MIGALRHAWILIAVAACGRDHFDPAHNYAFVTSKVYDPSTFGADLAGADAICATAASDAGLLGDYVAYIASRTRFGQTRIANARGWVRLDEQPFADSADDIVAGRLFHPLSIDELGEDVGAGAAEVATGFHPNGSIDYNCQDWTTPLDTYVAGRTDATSVDWVSGGGTPACTTAARLYCFGTSYDAPLAVTPAAGPRMFVTVQAFIPGGGLAAADALCANEAQTAGLGGTFLAMLPLTGTTAMSRFDMSRPAWVRPDGISLAASRLAFAAGELDTSPNVTALGTYATGVAITGGPPVAVTTNSTCADWTNPATASPSGGLVNHMGVDAFNGAVINGCSGAPIYCLEP
jgi:hypothetical protein